MAVDPAWLQSAREANRRSVGLGPVRTPSLRGLGDVAPAPPLPSPAPLSMPLPMGPAIGPSAIQQRQYVAEKAKLQAQVDQANQDALRASITEAVRTTVRDPIPWTKVGIVAGASGFLAWLLLGRKRNPRRSRRRRFA